MELALYIVVALIVAVPSRILSRKWSNRRPIVLNGTVTSYGDLRKAIKVSRKEAKDYEAFSKAQEALREERREKWAREVVEKERRCMRQTLRRYPDNPEYLEVLVKGRNSIKRNLTPADAQAVSLAVEDALLAGRVRSQIESPFFMEFLRGCLAEEALAKHKDRRAKIQARWDLKKLEANTAPSLAPTRRSGRL